MNTCQPSRARTVTFVKLAKDSLVTWWKADSPTDSVSLHETQEVVTRDDGTKLHQRRSRLQGQQVAAGRQHERHRRRHRRQDRGRQPLQFLALVGDPESTINLWKSTTFKDGADKCRPSITLSRSQATPSPGRVRCFKLEGSSSTGSTSSLSWSPCSWAPLPCRTSSSATTRCPARERRVSRRWSRSQPSASSTSSRSSWAWAP